MRQLLFIFILFFLNACYPNLYSKKSKPKTKKTETPIGNFIKLTAKNLSEDANILSTQNDELILLVYSKIEREFPENILQEEFVVDSINTSNSFKLTQKIKAEEKIILVLIERDTEQTLKQIEPVVRLNLKALQEAFNTEDNRSIKELLGDDDLLSITEITYKKFAEKALSIQGINLFDAYYYTLELE